MGRIYLTIFISAMIFLTGCAIPPPPATYVETAEPEWQTVSVRPGLDYDKAWNLMVDQLKQKYAIETIDKKSGLIRTGWIKDPVDSESEYKVRIAVKYLKDSDHIQVNADSRYHKVYQGQVTGTIYEDYGWIPGTDTKVLDEVVGDLSAVLSPK